MATEVYTPTGTFNDAILSAEDKELVAAYKHQWQVAADKGDTAGMAAAHARAEAIRARYNYSGGADGSEYNVLGETASSQPKNTNTNTTNNKSNTTIKESRSATTQIEDYYSAAQEASLAALKSAYDQNVLLLGSQQSKIAPYYQDARNSTGTQSELSRAAFNEVAAARGLNSGAGGQASLAMSNALLGSMSGLSRAEADAFAEIAYQRARLEIAYQNDIAQALANGELSKAQTLYKEFVRTTA